DQFARLKRWYTRLEEVKSGKRHDCDTQFYEDELDAFFIICYHLRDWIKADPGLTKAGRRELEYAVASDKHMIVCKGTCDGAKHFAPSRNGCNPRIRNADFKLNLNQGTISVDYV